MPDLIQDLLPMALTQLVAFLGFIWLLNHYAIKPVLKLLDERRDTIADKFNKIDSQEKRIETLKEEYEERLRKIDEEARKRTLEEVNRGRRIAEEIAENARAEAGEIIEKAKASVHLQIEQARQEIKEEVVEMTLAASERFLRERLDDIKHREMIGAFVDDLAQK